MKFRKLYDYSGEEGYESGLRVGLIFQDEIVEEHGSDFVPEVDGSEEFLVATYVDWYTEAAYLYVHRRGGDIEFLENVFDLLKENGFKPFEFQQITYRHPEKITIEKLGSGVKVFDDEQDLFFSTESSSNPISKE